MEEEKMSAGMKDEVRENKEYAFLYLAKGWPVIPIDQKAKIPLVRWRPYQDTLPTKSEVRQWWAQWSKARIGMVTGHLSGMLVIDCDSGEAILRFRQAYPEAEATLQASTGRGRHFFFVWEEGIKTGVGTLGTDIDVRSRGAFVVLPPSSHVNGNRYQWLNNNEPLLLSQGLREALLNRNGSTRPEANNNGGSMKGGRINEGERNNTLFSMGCAMRRKGMSQKTIEVALKEENGTKCDPLEGEIKVIARSAARYETGNSNGSGNHDYLTDGRILLSCVGGRPTPTVQIISGDDLIAEPINETPTILNPHIPVGGITLLFGPPGVGKTALNWALGNAIAEGEDFLGHQTIKGQMLFISLDMSKPLCQLRLHNTGFVPK